MKKKLQDLEDIEVDIIDDNKEQNNNQEQENNKEVKPI